jgi:hypothetical protein
VRGERVGGEGEGVSGSAKLSEKVEEALDAGRFGDWLLGIANPQAAFRARDCELCALGKYLNDQVGWEPILGVGLSTVFVSEPDDRAVYTPDEPSGFVCALPPWARAFVERHDWNRDQGEPVPLRACFAALGRAEGRP